MTERPIPKRLYRSRTDKRVAGILGGLAEYFHLDATWFRLAFVIVFLFLMAVSGFFPAFFLATLLYGIAWYVIPAQATS